MRMMIRKLICRWFGHKYKYFHTGYLSKTNFYRCSRCYKAVKEEDIK